MFDVSLFGTTNYEGKKNTVAGESFSFSSVSSLSAEQSCEKVNFWIVKRFKSHAQGWGMDTITNEWIFNFPWISAVSKSSYDNWQV
jgi:hypothetical protein